MKIDVTKKLVDYDGTPVVDTLKRLNVKCPSCGNEFTTAGGKKEEYLTWRSLIRQALNVVARGETLSGKDKDLCYQLTQRVFASDTPDLSVEERAFIIKRIDKILLNPLFKGRAKEHLEEKKQVTKK